MKQTFEELEEMKETIENIKIEPNTANKTEENNSQSENTNPSKKIKIDHQELLSLEVKAKPPRIRGNYVTKLQQKEKYERRKQQNREAQRRARERRAKILTKIQDFQSVIADLTEQLKVEFFTFFY